MKKKNLSQSEEIKQLQEQNIQIIEISKKLPLAGANFSSLSIPTL